MQRNIVSTHAQVTMKAKIMVETGPFLHLICESRSQGKEGMDPQPLRREQSRIERFPWIKNVAVHPRAVM